MLRILHAIRTVLPVAITLVVLAGVGLFGWWTAIAPAAAASGETLRPLHRPQLPRLTVVLDARCTVGSL